MKSLIIFGKASQKEIKKITILVSDYKLNLMDLLLRHSIPVASSCNGDGICLKCTVTIKDEKILTCQVVVEEIFKENDTAIVSLSYL